MDDDYFGEPVMATDIETSSRKIQQDFFESLGDRDWDEYKPDLLFLIKQKIAFAMFGSPPMGSDLLNVDENSNFGYASEQMKEVLPIYHKICDLKKYSPDNKSVYLSVIFICHVPEVPGIKNEHLYDNLIFNFKQISVVPVFRIRKCIKVNVSDDMFGCCFFIDHIGRIYKNWDGYLDENKLPQGIIIAPDKGRYHGLILREDVHVQLMIRKSPASKPLAKVRNVADLVTTGVALGTAGVLTFSLFAPVAAGVAITAGVASVATGVYGTAISSAHLVDRDRHGQTLNVTDSEARGCWLNIAASSAGIVAGASSKLLGKVVSNGAVVSKGFQVAHDIALVTAAITSGAGLVNGITSCIIRYQNTGERPTNLELFQLASSVLFFTNSLVSNKMASTIIEETQAAQISSYRSSLRSNRHRKIYDKMVAETRRINGRTLGSAEVIRSNIKIVNKDQFFQDALRINKQLNEHQVRISMRDGQALLNGEHVISPQEFYTLGTEQRASYLGSIGSANLSAENVPTALAVPSTTSIGARPIVSAINSIISVSKLIRDFPELSGSNEQILQYVATQLATFANEQNVYQGFISIMRYIEENMNFYMREQLCCLGISSTDLLFRIFKFCYEFLKDVYGTESGIADIVTEIFVDGHIQEGTVLVMLNSFMEQLNIDYKQFISRTEIRCNICNGITFSKD